MLRVERLTFRVLVTLLPPMMIRLPSERRPTVTLLGPVLFPRTPMVTLFVVQFRLLQPTERANRLLVTYTFLLLAMKGSPPLP